MPEQQSQRYRRIGVAACAYGAISVVISGDISGNHTTILGAIFSLISSSQSSPYI